MRTDIPPKSFRHHSSRVSTGAAPNQYEMRFVASRGYRKFICVGSFPDYIDRDFARTSSINLTHFPVPNEFELQKGVSEDIVANVLNFICKDNQDSQLFIFDDDGHSQVGIICALLRRIEGWCKYSAVEEFISRDPVKNSRSDYIKFICEFSLERWNN